MGTDLPPLNFTIMKNEKRFADICRMLLDGEDIDAAAADMTKIDNMLYEAFGASSGEILAEIRSVSERYENK